jgi:hypothetical protein
MTPYPLKIWSLRQTRGGSLEKEQVDFNLDVINVKRTKSGKGRTVPMTPRVRETLKLLCEDGDSKYVFPNAETGKAITDVKHSFTSAVSDAGITDFTFHDLRHTFGTRLAASGADVVKIRELMGRPRSRPRCAICMRAIPANATPSREWLRAMRKTIVTRLSQMKNGRHLTCRKLLILLCARHDSNVRPFGS